MNKTQEAVRFALAMANDPAHGYDQARRWGPDYDCSSFLIDVWERAGVPLRSSGASYTGNIRGPALRLGFEDVTPWVNRGNGEGMKPGDILLNYEQHVAMFVGGGQLVHASINELGTVTGGQTGDQTGREICVRSYYDGAWDCVLRYSADSGPEGPTETKPVHKTDELPMLRRGMMKNLSVLAMQAVLIARGFDCGAAGSDSDFGGDTEAAVRAFQEHCRIDADGVCGPVTWGALLGVK